MLASVYMQIAGKKQNGHSLFHKLLQYLKLFTQKKKYKDVNCKINCSSMFHASNFKIN